MTIKDPGPTEKERELTGLVVVLSTVTSVNHTKDLLKQQKVLLGW